MTTQAPEKNGQEQTADTPLNDEEVRKLTVLSSFGTREALSSLDSLATEIPDLEHAVTQAKLAVTLAEEGVELREAELAFETEGKNAEERKNALEIAKSKDETYIARVRAVQEVKASLAEAERAAQTARHRERYWHAFLQARTAQIHYLAG